jgi:PST family polysaccharide transporter
MKAAEGDKGPADSIGSSFPSLWQAFARGVRDNLLGEVAVQVLRIGGMVLLARALAPVNFGLLKILLIVSAFATLFCEFGIPDALIQRNELSHEHETTAWWLTLGLVTATVSILYATAPLIADAMAMKHLAPAIRMVCPALFLDGTAIVSVARLSRALRFSALALADVLAEAGFLVVAFALLWRGQPEWSLPGGLAARFVTHAITIWSIDRRVPIGMPRWFAARDLSRFATSVVTGRVITMASANADFILVGRLLGGTALGFYSMAWDLLRFVPDRLHRIAGRVALPAFCRLQDEPNELANAYLTFTNYVARAVLPIAACVAIAAPEVLTTLYGARWLPAAIPLRLLTVGLALIGLRVATGAVYYSRGYPSIDIFLNGTRLIFVVTAVLATARIGLVGVSGSMSAVEACVSIIGQYAVCLLTGLRLRDVAIAAFPGLRLAFVCGIATALGKGLATWGAFHGPLALVMVAAPAAIVFVWLEGGEVVQMVTTSFRRITLPATQLD